MKSNQRQVRGRRIVVVGAGAFGGWTALHLLRMGAKVTLVDAWGPGHSRSSSGGETRIIRATYGPCPAYYPLVSRSLDLWRENERRWKTALYRRTGLIWMAGLDGSYEEAAMKCMRDVGWEFEKLSVNEASRVYPQVNFAGVRFVIREENAGYLMARRACVEVVEAFQREKGKYRMASVAPGLIQKGEMTSLKLSDGNVLKADAFVFACGPWMERMFPGVVKIRSTRQEVYYFGTSAGDSTFDESRMPAWIDYGARLFYGIPGNEGRGFKMADDSSGRLVDPDLQERVATPAGIRAVRRYLAERFPQLKDAPVLGAEVCQYERTEDNHYIVDRHPDAGNVWLVCGGSGHGFKNGPALGEYAARLVQERIPLDPFFALARLRSVR